MDSSKMGRNNGIRFGRAAARAIMAASVESVSGTRNTTVSKAVQVAPKLIMATGKCPHSAKNGATDRLNE
jgi:hypothetical protein